MARQARNGKARWGMVWWGVACCGEARQERLGQARQGLVWRGLARQERRGAKKAGHGEDWHGTTGLGK